MLSVSPQETQNAASYTPPPPPPSPENQTPPPENHNHHIFTSKLPAIPIPNHLPLHTYCFQNLHHHPDRPCLLVGTTTGKSYSYAETHLLSRKVAAGLSHLGVKQHDVVMVLLHNSAEFVFTFLAASMIGAATTAANPLYTANELSKQLAATKSTVIVTQAQYVDKLREAEHSSSFAPFTIITTDDPPRGCLPFSALVESDENEVPDVEIDPNDAVWIPFSSGTTGLPKGVVLTHKGLVTSVAQQVDGENPNIYLHDNDVVLCVLPLFHIFSLHIVLLCSLRCGAAVLVMERFEIGLLLELVQRHRVSVAVVVPPLVLALAKNPMVEKFDLSSIRMVMSGAAPMGKELEAAFLTRLPHAVFGQGYGMTEAGPVISVSPLFAKEPLRTKSGSCGHVVRNAELKVIDAETGCLLPRNRPGEICIRGPQLMKGYLNDPESTARTIDADGWLHTGDIGYVDDDDDVFVVDRVKELIKVKGFQVAPAELEALLISHPNIADVAVVPQNNEVAGEVPVAFVVQSNGSELSEEVVKEFVAKQVVFYKRLHKVYFVEAIAKSPSGKILRKDLRAKLADASSHISSS